MKRLTIAALTLLVTVAFSTPTSATIYWQENFDGYVEGTGLNGQLGPNGVTWDSGFDLWNDPEIGSLAAVPEAGQDGTLGAGYWTGDTTGGGNNQASQIQMGTKVTSGMLYVDYDLHVGTGRQSGPQWWLRDTDTNINASIAPDWIDKTDLVFRTIVICFGTPTLPKLQKIFMPAMCSTLTTSKLHSRSPVTRRHPPRP